MVQRLRRLIPSAGEAGSNPGWGTKGPTCLAGQQQANKQRLLFSAEEITNRCLKPSTKR